MSHYESKFHGSSHLQELSHGLFLTQAPKITLFSRTRTHTQAAKSIPAPLQPAWKGLALEHGGKGDFGHSDIGGVRLSFSPAECRDHSPFCSQVGKNIIVSFEQVGVNLRGSSSSNESSWRALCQPPLTQQTHSPGDRTLNWGIKAGKRHQNQLNPACAAAADGRWREEEGTEALNSLEIHSDKAQRAQDEKVHQRHPALGL